MFALGIRYLNGYSAATEIDNYDRAEWPPHPGRIFMALVAAHHSVEPEEEEHTILQWLETLPAPEIHAPEAIPRASVTHYVPVNDIAKLNRSRQPRTFARAWLSEDIVWISWPQIEIDTKKREILSRLCEKVTRIGHSSSLVQMWLADSTEQASNWIPDDEHALLNLRIPTPGTLEELERIYNEKAIENYSNLLVATEDSTDKKAQKTAKMEMKRIFENEIPTQFRPRLSLTQGYTSPESKTASISGSVFNPNLLVLNLKIQEGSFRWLDLPSFPAFIHGFRNALLSHCNSLSAEAREILSGHTVDGNISHHPHLSFVPMAHVGSEYADGHILGVGLAFPSNMPSAIRKEILQTVGNVRNNGLVLGTLGKWSLETETRDYIPQALQSRTWTAAKDGCTHWSSVTPIVFEQHPKARDKSTYLAEVAEIIRKSCSYIGLPQPREIIPSPVSAHLGAPPSHAFPRLQRKDGSQRRHTHAILIFEEAVRGPILLGAGRYRGYGVMRPMSQV